VGVLPLFELSNSDIEKMEAKRDVDGLVKALSYKKDTDVQRAAVKALGNLGDTRAVDALITALKDEDLWVKRHAVEALIKIRGEYTVDKLIVALNQENAWVKEQAAEILGKIGDARAVEALIDVLDRYADSPESLDWAVRIRAVEALGRIGGEPAVEGLRLGLKDRDSGIRVLAAKALGSMKTCKARALAILYAHSDESERVRENVAAAIHELGRVG
jgi:hypothetical protein